MKLVLSISPDYLVKRWSGWEVVRELVQNVLDEQDLGHETSIRYSKQNRGTLILENEGKLSRDRLLLGSTSKADDRRTRGKFGEGLKIAMAVGLRLGMEFKIIAGDESWTPRIEYSEEFQSETVVVHTRKIKDRGKVIIELRGLSVEDWEEIQKRILSLQELPKEKYIEVYSGKILLDDSMRGKLFSKGLFVSKLDDFKYGYDLNYVQLDRDRCLAEEHSLNYHVRDVWKEAVSGGKATPELVMDILKSECGESTKCFGGETLYDYGGDAFYQEIARVWEEQYGANAIPVSTTQESIQAEQHGLRGVVVPRGMRNAVEKDRGSFDIRVKAKKSDVVNRFSWGDLTEEEQSNLLWISKLFERIGENALSIVIVEFVSEEFLGKFSRKDGQEEVFIARWVVSDRKQLLRTIAHEFSHSFGGDGTTDHRDALDDLYIRLVMALDSEVK